MPEGWIGVDLDGTLATYRGWNNGEIGEPVPLMLDRVKRWIAEGRDVKIVTARVAPAEDGSNIASVVEQMHAILQWCVKHVGAELDVTCMKDFAMIELWDDRCVQVVPNTGERVDGL